MKPSLWYSDPRLSDAEYRCLVAIDQWNRYYPDRRPTNEQVAEMCGWFEDGKPSGTKAKRILRELEQAGRIDRGTTGDEGRTGWGRITVASITGSMECVTTNGIGGNAPAGNDVGMPKVRFDPNRHPVHCRPPESEGITASALLERFVALLQEIAARGPSISFVELEDYASRCDALFGRSYDDCSGRRRDGSTRDRYVQYLILFEAVANGYSIESIRLKVSRSIISSEKYARDYAKRYGSPGIHAFERSHFYGIFKDARIEANLWCQKQRASDKRKGTNNFRSIMPVKANNYRLPPPWRPPSRSAS